MISGINTQRERLRLIVHNEPAHKPHQFSRYPVAAGQEIKSGQIITPQRNTTTNRMEWIRGHDSENSVENLIFIAYRDSTDSDVVAAGGLQGLSVTSNCEISSAWFNEGDTFNPGDEITYDGSTGMFRAVPQEGGNYPVFAYISKDFNSPKDFRAVFTPAPEEDSQSKGVKGGVYQLAQRSGAQSLKMARMFLIPPYVKSVAG